MVYFHLSSNINWGTYNIYLCSVNFFLKKFHFCSLFSKKEICTHVTHKFNFSHSISHGCFRICVTCPIVLGKKDCSQECDLYIPKQLFTSDYCNYWIQFLEHITIHSVHIFYVDINKAYKEKTLQSIFCVYYWILISCNLNQVSGTISISIYKINKSKRFSSEISRFIQKKKKREKDE